MQTSLFHVFLITAMILQLTKYDVLVILLSTSLLYAKYVVSFKRGGESSLKNSCLQTSQRQTNQGGSKPYILTVTMTSQIMSLHLTKT